MDERPIGDGRFANTSNESSSPGRRVVLIGGLDDGEMAADLLEAHTRVDLVGIFALDEAADGRHSGYRPFAGVADPSGLHEIAHIDDATDAIAALAPDLIVVVGFSQILPPEMLDIPVRGVVGFHSADLPARPGCSPIIWAIVEGLSETAVTMFYLNERIDSGDIIDARPIAIAPDDRADAVLDKANAATLELLEQYIDGVLAGTAPRTPQDTSAATYTRMRTSADAEVDWSRPATEILDLIRALSPPYPMAHTFGGDGVPILIERAHLARDVDLPSARYGFSDPLKKRVLCVVAHPDDEVLGVGGTLARHAAAGGEVVVLILSQGEDEKLRGTPKSDSRRVSAQAAAEALGTDRVIFYDFPDQRLDSVPLVELIRPIENAVREHRPQVVYTHHGGDANTDHQVTFKVTYAACRPMSSIGGCVERLLTFETPSSTDQAPQVGDYVFTPNCFVDVGPVWQNKVKALEFYPSEMIGGIHPRSFEYIEALARMRGGYAGMRLAEAFTIVRERLVL